MQIIENWQHNKLLKHDYKISKRMVNAIKFNKDMFINYQVMKKYILF